MGQVGWGRLAASMMRTVACFSGFSLIVRQCGVDLLQPSIANFEQERRGSQRSVRTLSMGRRYARYPWNNSTECIQSAQ